MKALYAGSGTPATKFAVVTAKSDEALIPRILITSAAVFTSAILRGGF
jgi:hypothetical protein